MDKKQKISLVIECIMLLVAIILLILGIMIGDKSRIIIACGLIALLAFNIRNIIKKRF